MSVVKNHKKILKLSILAILLLFSILPLPIVSAESFLIDVYDVDAVPHTIQEGEDVTISGRVKLLDAPTGYHMVLVEWYVDDNLEHRATHAMKKSEVKFVTLDFDTTGLSLGRHDVKINASVDSVTDEDSDHFHVEEEKIVIDVKELEVNPPVICVDEDETVELSVRVTLENGPDDTLVTAKFYVEGSRWDYIDKEEKKLDEDETRTFNVDYDYDAYDLDVGRHRVKVVVEAGDETKTEHSSLYVEECFPLLVYYPRIRYDIDVGYITLDPVYPEMGDIVLVSVPITLESARTLPEGVYVEVYVDGELIDSSSLWFEHLVTKTYMFTIDTLDYSRGRHTIEVKASVDTITDMSRRTFSIGPEELPEVHCLNIDDILIDKPLKAGEKTNVRVEVSNCGSLTEYNIKTSLTAFSKTYFADIYSISPLMSREVQFTIQVPENARGTITFGVRVYDAYTSDSMTKDFIIHTGIPLIGIKPEYQVNDCESNEIKFQVTNTGGVSDTFTLIIEGQASKWITGIPETISLQPNERRTINAYANIPCGTNEGYYSLTVTAKDAQKYSATTNLHVVKGWKWPIFPTGWFLGITGTLFWLPWALLFILIVLLYLIYIHSISERKRPMFE